MIHQRPMNLHSIWRDPLLSTLDLINFKFFKFGFYEFGHSRSYQWYSIGGRCGTGKIFNITGVSG